MGSDPEEEDPIELPPLTDEGVVTLTGSNERGYVDGERGTARLNNPVNIALSPAGDLYVADFDNSLIRVVSPNGSVRTLDPGNELFWRPFGMTFSDGQLYVQTDGDSSNDKEGALWRLDPQRDGAALLEDRFGRYRGMDALPDGRLVMAEYLNHVITLYDPATGERRVLAGVAGEAGMVNGSGAEARFDQPWGLVALQNGDIIVADHGNHLLRRVTLDGLVEIYGGTGEAGSADGDLLSAEFEDPIDLAVGEDEVIYVSDSGGYTIRRISPDGEVDTLAGAGEAGHRDAANPLDAEFFGMEGIAVSDRYLYIADGDRGDEMPFHYIRRMTLPQ